MSNFWGAYQLTLTSTCTYSREYVVLKSALTRTKVQHSAKSVQTTRVVCTNFSRSLYRLQLKFAKGYAHARI